MKITIKFNVNFPSVAVKYTLSLVMFAPWKSCRLDDIFLLQKERRFAIFHKVLLSKPVRRRFSIIKEFLKNFAKLTESYMWRRLFYDKVEDCRLKRDYGAGAFLWMLLHFKEQLCSSTCANCCFRYLGISLCRDIVCKVHIEEMHSFFQYFVIHSF